MIKNILTMQHRNFLATQFIHMVNVMKRLFLTLLFFSNSLMSDDIIINDIVRVYDGDTITINIANIPKVFGEKIGVRLKGFDTPELRGSCKREKDLAKQAKKYMEKIVYSGYPLKLKEVGRDKYFRLLGRLYVNNVDVADLMISSRLAYTYNGGTKQSWCN